MEILVMILVTVALLLLLPARLTVRIRSLPKELITLEVQSGFLFGLLPISLKKRIDLSRWLADQEPRERKRPTEKIWIKFLAKEWDFCRAGLRSLWATFFWRRVQGDFVFGCEDPAATGEMFGYLSAITPALQIQNEALTWKADFMERRFEGEVILCVYLSFLLTLGVALYLMIRLYLHFCQFRLARRRVAYD